MTPLNTPSITPRDASQNSGQNGAAFDFRFGAESCERHLAAAGEARLSAAVHRAQALAFDVDTPEDYARWNQESARPVL